MIPTGRAVALLLSLSLATSALATPKLDAAVALYRKGQFAKAKKLLETEVARKDLGRADRASARAYLIATLVSLKQEGVARAELERLFAEDPNVRLDEGEFPPRVIELAESVRPRRRVEVAPEVPTARAAPPPATGDAGVAAAPPRPSGKQRLVVSGMSALTPDIPSVGTLSEVMSTTATQTSAYSVMGMSDIVAILGFERQRQLMGCSDDSSSCMAELSDALGADRLLVGSVGKVGSVYRLDVRLLDGRTSKVLGRAGESVEGDVGELVKVTQRLVRVVLGAPAEVDGARRTAALVVGGTGAALLAGGGALGYLALQSYRAEQRASEAGDLAAYESSKAAAKEQILWSTVLYAAGAVGLGVGGYLFFSEPSAPEPKGKVDVAFVAGPGGGGALVRGRF